jgi:hypothetical protein
MIRWIARTLFKDDADHRDLDPPVGFPAARLAGARAQRLMHSEARRKYDARRPRGLAVRLPVIGKRSLR